MAVTKIQKTITIDIELAEDKKLIKKIDKNYGSFSEFVSSKLKEEKEG